MEWYQILLISIALFCIAVGIWHLIIYLKYYFEYKIHCNNMQKYTKIVNHTLMKVKDNIDRSTINGPNIIYDEEDIIDNLIFYEYKIENTYFPNVINDIIKEYIHYRLIWGINTYFIFTLYYPKGLLVNRRNYKVNARNVVKNYIYTRLFNHYNKTEECNKYKLIIEDGFELDNKLDIKVQ